MKTRSALRKTQDEILCIFANMDAVSMRKTDQDEILYVFTHVHTVNVEKHTSGRDHVYYEDTVSSKRNTSTLEIMDLCPCTHRQYRETDV